MANEKESNIITSLALFAVLMTSDQLSKYMIRSNGGFYICNTNLAFGLKPSYLLPLLLVLLLILFLTAIGNNKSKITSSKQIPIPKYKTQNSRWFEKFEFIILNLFRIWNLEFGILLIVSGAISNLTDRVIFGCVIDFINLKFWPVFNLADVYITMGSLAVIIRLLRKKQQESKASY